MINNLDYLVTSNWSPFFNLCFAPFSTLLPGTQVKTPFSTSALSFLPLNLVFKLYCTIYLAFMMQFYIFIFLPILFIVSKIVFPSYSSFNTHTAQRSALLWKEVAFLFSRISFFLPYFYLFSFYFRSSLSITLLMLLNDILPVFLFLSFKIYF